MKKLLALFSAFGLSVSESSSVASCDIFNTTKGKIETDWFNLNM